MGMPHTHIRCHGCDFERHLRNQPVVLRYEIAPGQYANLGRADAWCTHCEDLCDAERPIALAVLQQQWSALPPSDAKVPTWWNLWRWAKRLLGWGRKDAACLEAERERLSALLRLAATRQSPPRCLRCGHTSIHYLQRDEHGTCTAWAHTCGGHLYCLPDDPDAPVYMYHQQTIYLDAEGRPLPPP